MSKRHKKFKVLIADDDEILRSVFIEMLKANGEFLLTEASDGSSAVRAFKTERPEVVLLDLKMPDMDGIETMRQMNKIDCSVPIVFLTAFGNIPTAVDAIKCGAYDFLVKPPEFDKLLSTLKQAVEKRGPAPQQESSTRPTIHDPRENILPDGYKTLTPREREVLWLTADGLSSAQIAERLSISPRTVETHRANILQKLGLSNKTDLIRYVYRHGMSR